MSKTGAPIVIKKRPIWKPDITYKQLGSMMEHMGGQIMFLNLVRTRCHASPTGVIGITYENTRLAFSIGMMEITMRVRIPTELGLKETYTKPYAILHQMPIHPELPYQDAIKYCVWQQSSEDLFQNWLENCL